MSKLIFFVLVIFSFDLNSKYTNTNGMEVNKSIKDLIRWQRNQQKPIISSITISDEWRNIDLINAIQTEIDFHNNDFSQWEKIKKFKLTPEIWNVDDGHLTPTMKVKRKVIKEKYKVLINEIYSKV